MHRQPMYQKIHDSLLENIRAGVYQAGDLIPSEMELAEKYGVSRITTRQALNLLASEGRIIRRPGIGSVVLAGGGGGASGEGSGETSGEAAAGQSPGLTPGNFAGTAAKNRNLIGVIFDSFDFAFGAGLLGGIEWACTRKGFHVLFHCTYGSLEYEQKIIRYLVDAGVCGLIIVCAQNEVFDESILRLVLNDFPVILVDRKMEKIPVSCVCTDNYKAAKELTETLLRRGHMRIGFISHVYQNTSSIQERLSGYRDALIGNGIIWKESDCLTALRTSTPLDMNTSGDTDREDHDAIARFVMKHPDITAYFALNYKCGRKTMLVLRELGLESRKDVVFFDGPEDLPMERPYYARVIQDEQAMGEKAVGLLEEKMNGQKTESQVYVPYRIVY